MLAEAIYAFVISSCYCSLITSALLEIASQVEKISYNRIPKELVRNIDQAYSLLCTWSFTVAMFIFTHLNGIYNNLDYLLFKQIKFVYSSKNCPTPIQSELSLINALLTQRENGGGWMNLKINYMKVIEKIYYFVVACAFYQINPQQFSSYGAQSVFSKPSPLCDSHFLQCQ